METVNIPGGLPMRIDGETYTGPKKVLPKTVFIKITCPKSRFDYMNIHPSLAKKLPQNSIMASKVYGSIACPLEGVALTEDMFEVVI